MMLEQVQTYSITHAQEKSVIVCKVQLRENKMKVAPHVSEVWKYRKRRGEEKKDEEKTVLLWIWGNAPNR